MAFLLRVTTLLCLLSTSVCAKTLTLTGEGDILSPTCTIPAATGHTRQIDMGDIALEEIKNAVDGQKLRQQDGSLTVTHCPTGMTAIGLSLSFNAMAEHPQWIEPTQNPGTGAVVGVTSATGGEALDAGAIIRAPVQKDGSAVLPVFINVYAQHRPSGQYTLGESQSELILTLQGN
jgi:type 1 fimbria pilin